MDEMKGGAVQKAAMNVNVQRPRRGEVRAKHKAGGSRQRKAKTTKFTPENRIKKG
jgi:hypothetical protein